MSICRRSRRRGRRTGTKLIFSANRLRQRRAGGKVTTGTERKVQSDRRNSGQESDLRADRLCVGASLRTRTSGRRSPRVGAARTAGRTLGSRQERRIGEARSPRSRSLMLLSSDQTNPGCIGNTPHRPEQSIYWESTPVPSRVTKKMIRVAYTRLREFSHRTRIALTVSIRQWRRRCRSKAKSDKRPAGSSVKF